MYISIGLYFLFLNEQLIYGLFSSLQAASQVGALDVGYRPGFTMNELSGIKFLYLLGEVS